MKLYLDRMRNSNGGGGGGGGRVPVKIVYFIKTTLLSCHESFFLNRVECLHSTEQFFS